MTLSNLDWKNYIEKLSAINKKAANLMQSWIDKHGTSDFESMVAFAFSLTTRYGEAAAELACEMYDALALAQGAIVPAAEPALVATIDEVRKTLNGTSVFEHSGAINRLVKRTAADTTLNNAIRDGAQFAWVTSGDTCSFCIAISSRGWQYASKKALRNGHAEHIHGNCDCQYVVRFDGKSNVDGYDPDKLKKMYYDADGYSSQDKINAMRRKAYAENKDAINAQKRAAYARRKEASN